MLKAVQRESGGREVASRRLAKHTLNLAASAALQPVQILGT